MKRKNCSVVGAVRKPPFFTEPRIHENDDFVKGGSRTTPTYKCLAVILLILTACTKNIVVVEEQNPPHASLGVLASGGEEGDTGWWPSVIFDAKDRPHVSFCDAHQGDLKYATKHGDSWVVEDVITQGNIGKYTSIASDKNNHLAIAFHDQDQKKLRIATRDNEAAPWKTEEIAWGHEVGMGAELRFDAQNSPHVFYYTAGGKLVHATRGPKDGEWVKTILFDATGGYSARIDVQQQGDQWWISFVDWNARDTELYVAHGPLNALKQERIGEDHSHGWHSQLSWVGQLPRVTYTAGLPINIRVAEQDSTGTWHDQRVFKGVGNMAQAQLPNGDLAIAFEHITPRRPDHETFDLLRYASGVWTHTVIDTEGPVGKYLAMAADSQGRLVIAYYSTAIRGLKIYDETIPKP